MGLRRQPEDPVRTGSRTDVMGEISARGEPRIPGHTIPGCCQGHTQMVWAVTNEKQDMSYGRGKDRNVGLQLQL